MPGMSPTSLSAAGVCGLLQLKGRVSQNPGTIAQAVMSLGPGTHLGPYEIKKLLVPAEWVTFIVHDTRLDRLVAIKIVR